jgi:dTDP-glucose 4,6-dehydratase
MNLLVTGAAGFIGSNFVRYWIDRHPADHLVVLDLLTYAGDETTLADVRPRLEFVRGDIADRNLVTELLRAHSVDIIVNFAAESHNSLAVRDPVRFFATNVMGTVGLLEAAREVGVSRFHHVSTCEVYGDMALEEPTAFDEGAPYRPRTPYNASKAGADHAVRAYHETFALPVTITNCSNNYGPYQFPEKVIPLFVTNALDDIPLPVYASSQHLREWLHVNDHCSGIEAVLLSGTIGETYNVGSGREASVDDIANAILGILSKPSSLKETVPDRPGHDRRYLVDSTKLRQELGWLPTHSFEDGLARTVEWYARNRLWWEPLKARRVVDETSWSSRTR